MTREDLIDAMFQSLLGNGSSKLEPPELREKKESYFERVLPDGRPKNEHFRDELEELLWRYCENAFSVGFASAVKLIK